MINTDAYLALGLVVVATILGGYIGVLALRFRQAGKLIDTLVTLKEDK
ncbi:MAG: hypothetical protein J0M07_05565 [Anaerolineae bacterium]|jgi:hypothetical protein|nr:hypothetical protein [Chloroflexota bacterium]MBK9746131.1 hypothetical protein [Chloroflexota bacterium]MBN8634772.1 hypothetical protein [Anaerolineae bacterium]